MLDGVGDSNTERVWIGRLGGDGPWDTQEMWGGVREGCRWYSVAVLGRRPGNWVCGKRKSGEALWAVYLVLWQA